MRELRVRSSGVDEWRASIDKQLELRSTTIEDVEAHVERLVTGRIDGTAEAKSAAFDAVLPKISQVLEAIAAQHGQNERSLVTGVGGGLEEIVALARLRLKIDQVSKDLEASAGKELRKHEGVPIIQQAMKNRRIEDVVLIDRGGVQVGISPVLGLYACRGGFAETIPSPKELEAAGISTQEIRQCISEVLLEIAKTGSMPKVQARTERRLEDWRLSFEKTLGLGDAGKAIDLLEQLQRSNEVGGSARDKRLLLDELSAAIGALAAPALDAKLVESFELFASSEVAGIATSDWLKLMAAMAKGKKTVLASKDGHELTLGEVVRDLGDGRTFTHYLDVDGRCACSSDLAYFGLDLPSLYALLARIGGGEAGARATG
jgi:hypothetical protein